MTLNLIRYFAWNALLIGSLVLSTVFKFDTGITVLGVFFGFEASMYLLTCFNNEEGLKKIAGKTQETFKIYKIPFEVAFICLAFYLKHYFIGICMFATFWAWIYLFAATAKYRKGENDDAN